MANWASPIADLRTFLRDTQNDNLVKNKKLFGNTQAGQNRTFMTFEDRLLASGNQAICGVPLRLFWSATGGDNGVELSASGVLVTDQVRGEVQTMFLASGNGLLTGTYHFQQHLDSELTFFLNQAAIQVNSDTPDQVLPGLQLAAMNFAASMAHGALAIRWQQRKSEQFLLEDEPARKEAEARITFHQQEEASKMAAGLALRDSYYDLRMSRGKAPAYGMLNRIPSPWTPKW
jgi:hypothetical protein